MSDRESEQEFLTMIFNPERRFFSGSKIAVEHKRGMSAVMR
jgi:hypothetical protein